MMGMLENAMKSLARTSKDDRADAALKAREYDFKLREHEIAAKMMDEAGKRLADDIDYSIIKKMLDDGSIKQKRIDGSER